MIKRSVSGKKLLMQIIFLCIPAILMAFWVISTAGDYPIIGKEKFLQQTAYFGIGIILSCVFYSFRFRFLPSFIILMALLWLINQALDNFVSGEFDTFKWAIDFMLFQVSFLTGWVCGWGFSRLRYFTSFLAALLIGFGIWFTAKTGNTQLVKLVVSFAPVILFSFYIIYMGELIRNTNEAISKPWKRPVIGLLIYSAVMSLLMIITFTVFKPSFEALEVKWNSLSSKDENENSLFETMPDSTVKMKDNLKVSDNLNRGGGDGSQDFPLFVAYIDNFFPNTSVPSPLYFISEYLPLFDDYTETFEADSLMPYNDLFSPNPTKIPLYFTAYDSTVLINGMSHIHRKSVDAEVYKIKASPEEFTAPSTAYFCQPIAVKNELRDQFKSAYRAKMWVSDLNSAYLVYNNTKRDWQLQKFQEQRFSVLRSVKNYNDVDTGFVEYYTRYPQNDAYDTVRKIASQIISNAKAETPIDKILAVRDYFMEVDEDGKQIYSYSDKPTPVPPGSRILNFLLNEHKGNCTYYAGATLLMLRASGIPARVATGYAIVDRSSNNKGWYWVYNKQAHAWVQVFFPEYGWLDFDTTFGDSEQQEAPGADGTPPLDPQKAWFAGFGEVLDIDTVAKKVQLGMEKMVYKDLEYKMNRQTLVNLDLSLAKIYKDSMTIIMSQIAKGDKALALSFTGAEELPEYATPQDVEIILAHLPKPVPIDEFRIDISKPEQQKADIDENKKDSGWKFGWNSFLITLLALALIFVCLVIATPFLIYKLYGKKASKITEAEKDAYYSYRAAMFLLNQMGYSRKDLTPLQYAGHVIDPEFGTSFEAFVATYLKVKYAGQTLNNEEQQRILSFYSPFEQAVKAKFTKKQLLLNFINIYNTIEYFTSHE